MLKHRLYSGLSLAVVIISSIFLAPWIVLLAMLWGMMILCQREFIALATPASLPRHVKLLTQGLGVVVLAALFADSRPGAQGSLILWTLLGALWVLLLQGMFSLRAQAPGELPGLVLSLLYVTLCMGLMTHVVWGDFGDGGEHWPYLRLDARVRILYLLWVVKLSDVGAYAFGTRLGRHRLCPHLSPAKSWEGFFGGLAVGVLASLLAVWLGSFWGVLTFGYGHAVGLGLLLSLAGVAGDLSESMFKRSAKVKDSGSGFPGLGGILDMVDSLLLAGPVMLAYMRVSGVS